MAGLSSGGLGGMGGGLSSGGLGGLGSPGGHSTSGPAATSQGPSTNGWGTTQGAYGNPANAIAQALFAVLGITPGLPGLVGKGLSLGLGMGNKLNMFGQQPVGPEWLERLAPLRGLPGIGRFIGAGIAGGRVVAPATLSNIVDRKLELDVTRVSPPTNSYASSDLDAMASAYGQGPSSPTQSLDLDVSFANSPPGPSFTGWATEPGFVGSTPGVGISDLDSFAADYSGLSFSDPTDFDFSSDMAGVAGGPSQDEYSGYGGSGDPSDDPATEDDGYGGYGGSDPGDSTGDGSGAGSGSGGGGSAGDGSSGDDDGGSEGSDY